MSADNSQFDILVAGGGMVGSSMALGLIAQGWRVALVESQPLEALVSAVADAGTAADFEPRVSAISPASAALLSRLGVWSDVLTQRHCAYQAMEVWDGDGTGRIRFDADELHAPELGVIVENRILTQALFQALTRSKVALFSGVRIKSMAMSDGRRVVGLDSGQVLTADLVVASDGAHSRIRQWSGLPTREWDYDQHAVVCTVETELDHQFTAWQRFTQTGPLALLPLLTESGASRFCSVVWSQDTDEARRLMALDDQAFCVAIGRAFEHRLGAILGVSKRYSFALRQCHAKDYVDAGVVLVGDAAHSIHPLAGQGANLGFSDVRVLLDELAQARITQRPASDDAVLHRYQRRRKGENLAMMAAMEGFKRLFARDELSLRWLRNTGMRWLNRTPGLRNRFAIEAMGLRSQPDQTGD
ncbi:UbiH/UbiF/VisC/COQ6 family ubiquinone biosynthesis hydroxylase [Marinobacter caseinilyticus]|uniref:UbiH/UbiF/VisC/COQ6 family ubiquinone biosynthesis hydroxylase n=1 Tax=Marinobacter caseinilyticus TaxID=2692195 RepID=UPI00140B15F3|nr:UbiH/UbiF/VisC/COQ6 family ubiquinone biosynthesis hydroxylase [Marinobacter caseinilyticus]